MSDPTTNTVNNIEAGKDAGRNTIFSMVSVIVTYFINMYLPKDMPIEVRTAVIGLALAGITYALTYVDSWLHRNKSVGPKVIKDLPGLTPF